MFERGSKRGPELAPGPASARCFERQANRGGMMREILDDEHAIGFAFNLHATADALKGSKGPFDGLAFDAAAVGERYRRQGVEHVMPASDRHSDASDFSALVNNTEFGGCVVPLNIPGAPVAICGQAEGFHGAKRLADGFL